MKFQFISEDSGSLALAQRLKEDNHTVFFFNKNRVGEGLLQKKKNVADVTILDGITVPTDGYINKIGASKVTNLLLTSPDYARTVLRSVNIPAIDKSIFTKEGIYPDSDNNSPVKSDEIEVIIETYFNGESFLKPPYLVMDLFLRKIRVTSKIYQKSLCKLEKPLRAMDYKGPLGLRLIITKDDFRVLEFERRFRYSLFETLDMKLAEFLLQLNSTSLKTLDFSSNWMIELPVLTLPIVNIPIDGVVDENKKHIWMRDIYRQNNGIFSAGQDGLVLFITSYGRTPNEAKRRAYRTFSNLTIPYARVSFVDDNMINENYKSLYEWGWINGK